jgi:hypothetical protein
VAVHEAGHAVVAWALGLPVGRLSVNDDYGNGATDIGDAMHLSVIDQAAICGAGEVATNLLGTPTPRSLASSDHVRMLNLTPGSTIEERQIFRAEGLQRAHELLWANMATLVAVPAELEQAGSMDAAAFENITR